MFGAVTGRPASRPDEGAEEAIWGGLEELRESLRGYLGRQCVDEHELDDAVQETLLRAARYRALHEVQCLRGWVLRIGRNVIADGRRRRFRAGQPARGADEQAELDSLACAEPEVGGLRCEGSWFDREEVQELVQRGLRRLAREDDVLLRGFYARAQPLAGLARQAGVPQHLARVRLYRARIKLRAVVAREVSRRRLLGLAS